MELITIILIVFLVASFFSMLGLGGAIIYTPLFYWIGFPLLSAIPMALFINSITTASASITYSKQKLINAKFAFPIIVTASVGAFVGSYIASVISSKLIVILLSISLFLASLKIIFFNNITFTDGMSEKKKKLVASIFGFLIGIVSSLAGIGGGTFIVPLLIIIGFETKNAVATSAFIIVFTSISGFMGHIFLGHHQINLNILFYSGIVAFIGAQIGSRIIFKHTSSRTIEHIFAVLLLFISGRLLYGIL